MRQQRIIRKFDRKHLPEVIRLYKKGWNIEQLKRKFRCYGNAVVRNLIAAGVYQSKNRRSATPEYGPYIFCRALCWNKKHRNWLNYGGRGIQFQFENLSEFVASVGPRPGPNYCIGRKDNNGHFAPGNLYWRKKLCLEGLQRGAYKSYCCAKHRCTHQSHPAWTNYGGRGIKFLFKSFEEWFAELGPRPEGHSVDRIDVNGHYEPGNVRWATASEQNSNQRRFVGENKTCESDDAP